MAEKDQHVTCDICNFTEPYGVMGFDGYSEICNCDKSEHFGKEIGFFSCDDCWFGETDIPMIN